jgi:hypothetical protein
VHNVYHRDILATYPRSDCKSTNAESTFVLRVSMLLETSLPGQKNNEDHVSNVEYHTECVTQKTS